MNLFSNSFSLAKHKSLISLFNQNNFSPWPLLYDAFNNQKRKKMIFEVGRIHDCLDNPYERMKYILILAGITNLGSSFLFFLFFIFPPSSKDRIIKKCAVVFTYKYTWNKQLPPPPCQKKNARTTAVETLTLWVWCWG